MKQGRKNIIYGNVKIYYQDILMFLTTEKRANWYLSNDLGIIRNLDPMEISLTFHPKGFGNDNSLYYLSEKRNACVVCNDDDISKLTKHHVVPVEFRKYFPTHLKNHSSHDVLPICQDHHYDYENNYASKLKNELYQKYGIVQNAIKSDRTKLYKLINLAKLLNDFQRSHEIPRFRRENIKDELHNYFNDLSIDEIANLDHNKIFDEELLNTGKQLIDKIEDLDEFTIMWRKHFIDSMNPQYMPIGWDIYTKNKNLNGSTVR